MDGWQVARREALPGWMNELFSVSPHAELSVKVIGNECLLCRHSLPSCCQDCFAT